jgi:hypothetical protein
MRTSMCCRVFYSQQNPVPKFKNTKNEIVISHHFGGRRRIHTQVRLSGEPSTSEQQSSGQTSTSEQQSFGQTSTSEQQSFGQTSTSEQQSSGQTSTSEQQSSKQPSTAKRLYRQLSDDDFLDTFTQVCQAIVIILM